MSEILNKVRDAENEKSLVQQEDNVIEFPKPELYKTDRGAVKKIRANLRKLLTGYDDNLSNLFRYNENTHTIEVIEDRELSVGTIAEGVLDDMVVNQIISYVSETYQVDFKDADVSGEIRVVAKENSYNPIKNFLEYAKKTTKFLEPFPILRKYINIEDTDYNKIALDLFMRGAIARVLHPGVKFDYCLDLVGVQGGGKTTFARDLFMGVYYTDQISSFSDKDDLLKMIGVWGVNDDELVASNKMSFGELKKTITLTEITVRPPYARAPETTPIDFVYMRTTNNFQHLADATGDRRFLPIKVGKKLPQHKHHISKDDLRDIWGAYYISYLNNKTLFYHDDSPEGQIISAERDTFKRVDDVVEKIEWYLEQPIPSDFYSEYTRSWQRKQYYRDLEEGVTPVKSNTDKVEWVGDTVRDRVSINDMMDEIFSGDRRAKNKIKLFFDVSTEWEYKRTVKFGKRQTSGYLLVGKKLKNSNQSR